MKKFSTNISQSTNINWREIELSPFLDQRPKKKKPFDAQFKINRTLEEQYGQLTLQSVKKDYEITNLTPFSSSSQLSCIVNQISRLGAVSPTTDLSPEQKQTLKKRVKVLASKFKLKKLKLKKPNKAKFIKTQLMFDDVDLMEDFSYDINEDKKVKEKVFKNINNRLKTKYPEQTEQQNQNDRIVGFKRKSNRVKRSYTEQISYKSHQPLKIDKEAIFLYSKYRNKLYSQNAHGLQSEGGLRRFQGEGKKNFFRNYFKSYGQRKNILQGNKAI